MAGKASSIAMVVAGPGACPTDVVTQLQTDIGHVTSLLYNFIGTTQRDAAPCSIKGEGLIHAGHAPEIPVRQGGRTARGLIPRRIAPSSRRVDDTTIRGHLQIDLMAEQLTGALAALGTVIHALPQSLSSEEQQISTVVELQRANVAASQALHSSLERAQGALSQAHASHSALADIVLQHG